MTRTGQKKTIGGGTKTPLPLFYDLDLDQLHRLADSFGWPSFRAVQLHEWQLKGITDFAEMTNMPKTIREQLNAQLEAAPLRLADLEVSQKDGTKKALFALNDGHTIETVAMFYGEHASVCVSSQVGCRMGCRFCASTGLGFARNLRVGEMLGQVLAMQREIDRPVTHVTVMGIGEPLENMAALIPFIRRLADPKGLHISMRRITVSTCGLPDMMLELANAGLPINVAVSLHAPNQRLRESLMPIAKRFDLETLLDVSRTLTRKTGRRITFEYALFNGINDQVAHAEELAGRLQGMLCHVNLIPANRVDGTPYDKSPPDRVARFRSILESRGIVVSVRRELGNDITAACGQLRRKRDAWTTP